MLPSTLSERDGGHRFLERTRNLVLDRFREMSALQIQLEMASRLVFSTGDLTVELGAYFQISYNFTD